VFGKVSGRSRRQKREREAYQKDTTHASQYTCTIGL
jgi:hypothetical protein